MATLKANGGAVRRWVNTRRRTGVRLVLCVNGRFLIDIGAGKWRRWKDGAMMTAAQIDGDPTWNEVTTPRWPARNQEAWEQ
ncbi:MAG TPA: hypothetical protein VGI19_08355 [Candidatus Cybelea sp.]|jgi:hypothetical protein